MDASFFLGPRGVDPDSDPCIKALSYHFSNVLVLDMHEAATIGFLLN